VSEPAFVLPLTSVADASRAEQISAIVAIRSRRGLSQEKRFAPSHERAPVAPAPAAIAFSMHCMHMSTILGPRGLQEPDASADHE
jgi:hypothetical protein